MKRLFVAALAALSIAAQLSGCGSQHSAEKSISSASQAAAPTYGFIDKTGNTVLTPTFDAASSFQNGFSLVRLGYHRQFMKSGFMDRTGQLTWQPRLFTDGLTFPDSNFSEGLALINEQHDGRDIHAYYIDTNGKVALRTDKFSGASAFRDGIAKAQALVKDRYGDDALQTCLITKDGKVTWTGFLNWSLNEPHEGLVATLNEKGQWGYLDKDGKWAIEPKYHYASDFSDGVALVGIGGKLHPTTDGEVPPRLSASKLVYCDERYMLCHPGGGNQLPLTDLSFEFEGGQYGLINKRGEWVIPPPLKFSYISRFSNGLAVAGDSWQHLGYIDKTGKYAIQPAFQVAFPFSESLAAVMPNDGKSLMGFIDSTGKLVIKPQYAMAMPFSEGLACVFWSKPPYWFTEKFVKTD